MKKIILLITITVYTITLLAQESYKDIIERINGVDYIFEGIVIESKPYKTADEKMIYTSNLIQITKVFKGSLVCGTVEVITVGGEVGDREIEMYHTLNMEKGYKGVFLCNETNREQSQVDFFFETNNVKLEATYENQSYIKYIDNFNEMEVYDMWHKFIDKEDLYDYIKSIVGYNYIDCNNSSLITPVNNPIVDEKTVFPKYTKASFDSLISLADFQRANYTRPKTNRSNNTIYYELANLKVTGAITKYLEFDVTIRDNIGTKYLDQSAVRIKYPTNVFGSNIVANNKIQVFRGVINSDTICYSNVIPSDDANNAILIPALEQEYSQCKKNITTTHQTIMRIKIEIQNCNVAGSSIAIEDIPTPILGGTLMENYSAFAEFPNDTLQTYYDYVVANDIKPIPSCSATITDFHPKIVNGGVRDIVVVEGFQFGTTRGTGNLYFYDANNPTGLNVPLEGVDIITWSDTMIKFYVPSIDTGTNPQTIGTGFFRLVNSVGEKDTADLPLNIYYSLINNRDNNFNKKFNSLSNMQGGGYKFYVDTAVWKNSALMGCIKKAIDEWVCATGVNFVLLKDTFGIQTGLGHIGDGINLISYGALPGTSIAAAIKGILSCPAEFYQDEIDLVIDPSAPMFYDTTLTLPLPYQKNDIYRAILHELGHAIGHAHIISPTNIMHWQLPIAPSSGLPAYLRYTNLKADASAINGGKRCMYISVNDPQLACHSPIIALPTCAGYTHIENIGENISSIICYPNPFDNKIIIESNTKLISSIQILSIDGKIIREVSDSNSAKIIIDTYNFISSGTYIIKIIENDNTVTFKKLVHL